MENTDIRKTIKEKRNSLSKEEILSKSEKIFKKVKSIDLSGYNNFFIYKSFNKEVLTDKIITFFLEQKKNVSFPVIEKNYMIAAKPCGKEIKLSKFGTEEPKNYIEIKNIEVCFLPLIACDLSFNRLGYGKGFYDRFLSGRNFLKIGLCYDFQVVEKVNKNSWDIPLDIIITETKIIKKGI